MQIIERPSANPWSSKQGNEYKTFVTTDGVAAVNTDIGPFSGLRDSYGNPLPNSIGAISVDSYGAPLSDVTGNSYARSFQLHTADDWNNDLIALSREKDKKDR